jgi:predicted HTH transcriptional regulator
METLDLFSYPKAPGYKAEGTSRTAAEKVRPQALSLRDQVLALLRDAALTADECAAKLDKSILSIRPRLSELLALGKIHDTGRTRANASGIRATVWKACT